MYHDMSLSRKDLIMPKQCLDVSWQCLYMYEHVQMYANVDKSRCVNTMTRHAYVYTYPDNVYSGHI